MILFQTGIQSDQIEENEIQSVELTNGSAVILTRVDGKLIAFSATCPHASGDFREGEIHRGHVYCPVHQWKFDIKSGRCVGDENYRIKKYPVRVAENEVVLEVPS